MSDEIKNDGGPAFPLAEEMESGRLVATAYGISMRDWFAGIALQGYLAKHSDVNGRSEYLDNAAHIAYRQADAMLKERENE